MKIKNIKEKIFYLVLTGITIFALIFLITCTWIGYDAKALCQSAQRQYGGDCVEALISQLDDEHQSFRDRNSAIWGLGQLGDRRALTTLESYYTGNIPDREPLDETISQYELKKAINLTSGGVNLGAFIWRRFF
jgi:hypothetical protein